MDSIATDAAGLIEISLHDVTQLFNSLDPSPFYERELDTHADAYLVSWAQDLPRNTPLALRLHLRQMPQDVATGESIRTAVQAHFAERTRMARLELRRLLRRGRASLMTGVTFLVICLFGARLLSALSNDLGPRVISESLLIIGWVAMWRPLEIYLYDWWPLRDQVRLYQRMSRMPVDVVTIGERA